jgi:hypothetical protein
VTNIAIYCILGEEYCNVLYWWQRILQYIVLSHTIIAIYCTIYCTSSSNTAPYVQIGVHGSIICTPMNINQLQYIPDNILYWFVMTIQYIVSSLRNIAIYCIHTRLLVLTNIAIYCIVTHEYCNILYCEKIIFQYINNIIVRIHAP